MKQATPILILTYLTIQGFLLMSCDGNSGGNSGSADLAPGNGIRGGELYDSIWIGTGTDIPDWVYIEHPFTTLRCKSCHGWDYRGSQGVYGGNYNPKDFAIDFDLSQSSSQSVSYLTGAILATSIHPDYSEFLSDEDIEDLVAFLKNEIIDTSSFFDYDSSSNVYRIQAGGDPDAGNTFIANNCSGCHGSQTDEIKTDLGRYSLGSSMRLKWFETHHKVRYGAPGTAMRPISANAQDIHNMLAAFCNFNNYPTEYVDEEDPDEIAYLLETEQTVCGNYN